MQEFGYQLISDGWNFSDSRFFDNEELKFSLRSLECACPWIRRIFIVTDDQKPSWIKQQNSKICFINHRDVIDQSLLPTFNSVTIENHCILNIPDLSEHFIYLNDDMFFGNWGMLKPSDFFDDKGNPISRFTMRSLNNFAKKVYMSSDILLSENGLNFALKYFDYNDWELPLFRSWLAARGRYGDIPYLGPAHVADGMRKSWIQKTFEIFPEILTTNTSPFRTGYELQRILWNYVFVYELGGQLRICEHLKSLKGVKKILFKLRNFFNIKQTYLSETICFTENDFGFRETLKRKPKLLCINSADEISVSLKKKTYAFLNSLYPNKSSFEK